MGNPSIDTAVKGVKELDRQVGAFQSRLDGIKSDIESARRTKDQLDGEIEARRTAWNNEVEKKHLDMRKEESKLREERDQFLADKAEFEKAMVGLQKERNALEREKQDILDMKTNAQASLVKSQEFIRSVRQASEKLF